MKVHELIRSGELLVAGMARLGATKWPFDTQAFARATEKQTAAGNQFAAKFRSNMGALGTYSHDFREIQAYLHTATLISYDSLDNDRFYVRISKRISGILFRRNDSTMEEQAEVDALLHAHWEETYGQPWQAKQQ